MAACNGRISTLMTTAEETEEPPSPSGARKACEQFAFILVMICCAECAQCRPPKAFHIQVPGFFCCRSGKTGDTSEAEITGQGGTTAIGTGASDESSGTGSQGIPRISLTNSASVFCTPSSRESHLPESSQRTTKTV